MGMGGPAPPIPGILIAGARAGLEQVCLSVIPSLKVKVRLVIENRHNTITSTLVSGIVKTIDDTPVMKTESERLDALSELIDTDFGVLSRTIQRLVRRVEHLELQVANLETQRTPQDENDDPEWY